MKPKKTKAEKIVQAEVEIAIGSMPDVTVLKNSVGLAEHFDDDGKSWKVPYGLGVGSPDLVAMLSLATPGQWAPAVWVAFEVKTATGRVSPEQTKCHAIWRSKGVLVYVVRSAPEAVIAVNEARNIVSMWLGERLTGHQAGAVA